MNQKDFIWDIAQTHASQINFSDSRASKIEMTEENFHDFVKQALARVDAFEQQYVGEQMELCKIMAKTYENGWNAALAQRRPISEEQLNALCFQYWDRQSNVLDHVAFARAIERNHGIEETDG
jgi:hypothetical protein